MCAEAEAMGRRGLWGFIVVFFGQLFYTCLLVADGIANPILAQYAPALVHSADDAGAPAIFRGPVVSNGQAKLVSLARRLAEERKVTDLRQASALHFFVHAGVINNEPTFVEHVVTHEPIDELLNGGAKLRRLLVQFGER
jgi:hypothetical protein